MTTIKKEEAIAIAAGVAANDLISEMIRQRNAAIAEADALQLAAGYEPPKHIFVEGDGL